MKYTIDTEEQTIELELPKEIAIGKLVDIFKELIVLYPEFTVVTVKRNFTIDPSFTMPTLGIEDLDIQPNIVYYSKEEK